MQILLLKESCLLNPIKADATIIWSGFLFIEVHQTLHLHIPRFLDSASHVAPEILRGCHSMLTTQTRC